MMVIDDYGDGKKKTERRDVEEEKKEL